MCAKEGWGLVAYRGAGMLWLLSSVCMFRIYCAHNTKPNFKRYSCLHALAQWVQRVLFCLSHSKHTYSKSAIINDESRDESSFLPSTIGTGRLFFIMSRIIKRAF